MTTSPTNTYPNRPIFDDYEIKENTPVPLASQGLFSQIVSSQEEYIQDVSVTVDCLRVPIQHLSLETLNEANEPDKSGFYALAQNIFQFSIADREEIYNHLQLDERQKDDLENLHDSSSAAFQKELKNYIQSFAESIPLDSAENVLSQLADRLEINLVILKQQQGKIEVVRDQFSTATCYEWDHKCFRSDLCVAVAEQKGLFKKSKDRVVQIECNSQSAAKVREVYAELAQIRKTILAIHNHEKTLDDLNDGPYKLWYEKHVSEGVLNTQAALRELSQAEIDIQDFSENVLKQELRNNPLAVIREKLPTQSSYQLARHDFEHEGEKYAIKRTRGDGACALHALLGEEIGGEYRLPGSNEDAGSRAKTLFTNQLRQQLTAQNETIIERFTEAINPLIRAPSGNPSAKMLFRESEEGRRLLGIWEQLQVQYNQTLEELRNQEAVLWLPLITAPGSSILSRMMQEIEEVTKRGVATDPFYGKNPEQTLKLLTETPKLILNFISAQPAVFLDLLRSEVREQIGAIRERQAKNLAALRAEEKSFIVREDVINHYVGILNDPDYYLNTQEIRLAAYLFDKKVQVVASGRGGINRSETLMNESGSGELVVIHHRGIHFERCITLRQPNTNRSSSETTKHDFEHEGQKYLIKPTLAGEVSALHALLGKETLKGYAYPAGNTNSSVKEYFTNQLKRALESTKFPTVEEAFAQIIIPYMNDPENGSIFKELCQPSNRKDIFDQWNQKFNTGDQNQRDRFTKQKNFILSCPDILQSYTAFINQPDYWLGMEELRLAAHLFDKKVQVVASREKQIVPIEPLLNLKGKGELVVIHYDERNHFEHCEPIQDSSLDGIREATKHKDLNKYEAINLKKLQNSSLVTYGSLALCKALENVLDFISHKQIDEELFEILYGSRPLSEVEKEYDAILNGVTQSLGIEETWSLGDEQIVDKISSLIWNLQSHLPKGLRGNRTFVLDPRFAKLREISSFIQKKRFVEELAQQIAGKKLSEIKAILRKSQKIQDFNKVKEIASELQKRSVDKIKETLFQEFYKGDYNEELEGFTKDLHEIGQNLSPKKGWSIHDENILDEINKVLLLHTQEKNREYHEKSLDQLCNEYAELNGIDSSNINAIKARILNIRLSIEDLKQGKTLPNDTNQQYPIALIAEICVKIEQIFGDMLRDTQLLAILSMLDSNNPRGGLSQLETGEGKTYVIVALAIIKNKQGHEVDVITSSPTLAKRDVESFKAFYQQQFGISCAHNCDSDVGMMANPCYQPNSIVYGTTASFEGDSLRSEFYQADTFNGRQRGIAIVDEADSALLDKASWLCQISDSVAGMSTTRPLLYYIWALVLKKVDEAKDRKFETQEAYDAFLQEIKEEITKNSEEFFSGGDQSFVIPQHLKEFAKYRISYWVDSALRAIFYTQDREYNACQVLKKITPIDYANTGEWEKDVQWEDGLHQFLQMKNGMGVETETLTKSFMSNYTLINKYTSIYGLSGTLGEKEEAETFRELYGVTARKIPKFKICCYEEKPAWISSGKEQWLDSLYTDVVKDGLEENSSSQDALPSSQTERCRASLIICKTIADVREVEKHFKDKGIKESDIVTYTKGDEDKSKIKEATKGKIIIATNLSGRGTDIDASSIEEAGGLHVIFSFLPANRRIQDQGFGRTARKGLSGTARLIIKQEEIKEHHLKKEEKPLLDICNDIRNSNLQGFKLSYENNLWEVESDSLNSSARELIIKRGGNSPETKIVRLSHLERQRASESDRKRQQTYNAIEIDGLLLDSPKNLQACSFNLTYDSIMDGRNQREEVRLRSLRSDEKGSLITKQALFEGFQRRVHSISQGFTVDPRLNSISSSLLELYKSYILDEWAIFLDRVSKNLEPPNLDSFDYERDLKSMIEKNDLYKMQYMNASIDVDNEEIRSEADAFYAQRGQKVDITGGFAWYNRVFVTLKNNKGNISEARSYLNKAKEIFEKGEQYEKGILKIQHALTSSDDKKPSDEDMEGTPMLRLILTMKALIKRNQEELDKLAKDYSKLKVSFTNAYDLKEKPSSSTEKKDDDEKGYTIPDDLMQEAIKLGLKGPLKLEGEGDLWKAIVCAIVCVIVAIAAIAAIALSGGAAAPLVALVGGKVAFGIIAGAVAGAAISGAINSIKGAVNGDFNFNSFGKDVLTGLITGAIGGGVAAGLSGLATGVLQTATTLTRVAINAGIGAASGIAAGSAGYLIGSGLHGREITWEGLGKAVLQGAVGGALGGGFVGLAPHGTNSIRWAMLTGTLGSTAGNAAIQGIQIAMGDRKKFDGFELLENGLQGGIQAGIMAGAQKYAANQALKQNQRMVPYNEGANEGGNASELNSLPQDVRERVAGMSERLQKLAYRASRDPIEGAKCLRLLNDALKKQGQAPIEIVCAEPQHARNIPQQNQQQRNGLGQSGEANNQQAANLRQNQRMDPRPQAGRNHQTQPQGGIVAQLTPKVNDSFKSSKNNEALGSQLRTKQVIKQCENQPIQQTSSIKFSRGLEHEEVNVETNCTVVAVFRSMQKKRILGEIKSPEELREKTAKAIRNELESNPETCRLKFKDFLEKVINSNIRKGISPQIQETIENILQELNYAGDNLRELIEKHLKDNRLIDDLIEGYVRSIETNNIWGGFFELEYLGTELNLRFKVSLRGKEWININNNGKNIIYLEFTGDHYNVLHKTGIPFFQRTRHYVSVKDEPGLGSGWHSIDQDIPQIELKLGQSEKKLFQEYYNKLGSRVSIKNSSGKVVVVVYNKGNLGADIYKNPSIREAFYDVTRISYIDQGGSYLYLKEKCSVQNLIESNHMPPKAVAMEFLKVGENDLPAVSMYYDDHRLFPSTGNRRPLSNKESNAISQILNDNSLNFSSSISIKTPADYHKFLKSLPSFAKMMEFEFRIKKILFGKKYEKGCYEAIDYAKTKSYITNQEANNLKII